jgi:hypothetical protein
MRRALAAWGTVLLVALPLSACGNDGVKASSKSNAEPSTSAEPSEALTELPSDAPTDLPTDLPTDVPTEVPTADGSGAPAGAFDSCAVVTADLIEADFGADAGQSLDQASSLGDPNAGDCFYFGGDATIVIQATTRADQDLPESSYSYEGLPGAEEVPGADRGWAYVFPNQSGSSVTSGLILVKDQLGLQCSITIEGHPYTNGTLLTFAQHILDNLG